MQVGKKEDNGNIYDFIQRNRKGIFIFTVAIIIMVIGLIVFFAVQDSINKKAIAELEELAVRFDEIINDENKTDELDKLIEELNSFGENNSGVAAARAYSYLGRIYADKEDWPACEEAWHKASVKGDKTYLAPIALFNTAAALEEQGNLEKAIEYLQQCVDHPFEFPAAPRAQFNIGRLNEQLGNIQEAIEAYRAVMINWPEIPIWQDIARTAIIRLEIKNETLFADISESKEEE